MLDVRRGREAGGGKKAEVEGLCLNSETMKEKIDEQRNYTLGGRT
jgi:hypothetical protein